MNRILLALTILSAGAGGFLAARQSTTRLQREAEVTRETWLVQTQLVTVAQNDQAGLVERVRQLKQALSQVPAVTEHELWSALQSNRAGQVAAELRERLLEELGFNWKSSEEFIVVSKDTVRDIQMQAIRDDKLTDMVTTVLAITPGERAQVEAALQRLQTDFKDWALAHTERVEPKDDVVAHYTLPGDPALSVSNNFATGVFAAVGRERAELILPSVRNLMSRTGILNEEPTAMIIKRYQVGNEQRLKVERQLLKGHSQSQDLWLGPQRGLARFPEPFRPLFPNGWADVAEREGFELPKESPEK